MEECKCIKLSYYLRKFQIQDSKNNAERREFLATQTALGRIDNADDIGGVVAFLCSDEARWVNAQRIEVKGAESLKKV
ncbi:MAG TPA: SDR family oxidoreductase [Lentimicrobium sp.]|nr:SDR family oxidoreductase [Lentimicrobium sp.]